MARCVFVWGYGDFMQGVQCWDQYGRLVVDVGDYNMRYVSTVYLNVGPGANAWSVPVWGMRPNGWLAILRTNLYWNDYYCIPGDNAFTVQYLPVTSPYTQTIIFDVYKYDV